jgi:TolB protein
MNRIPGSLAILSVVAATALMSVQARSQSPAQPPPSQPPSAPAQQPSELSTTITSDSSGAPPRFAVPDFIALTPDADTAAVAKLLGQVLYDDFNFEREFALIPRDTYASIPAAHSFADVPFDRWRELGTDAVLIGTVQKTATGLTIEARLFSLRSQQSVFSKQYSGSASNPRAYAHTIADEVHQQQRALRGVARTKLAFDSDRDGERIKGTIENRSVKEIYISDYDGENQRRVTTGNSLNITPTWSPDARSIAYTSYRRGAPNIFISNIFQGTLDELTSGPAQNFTPVWSPDGVRLAFASTRDGNMEIYVANRDGSNVRRVTYNPAVDVTPTWSPSGTQIAFTSDRTGAPQIYVVGADGLGLQRISYESYADRPTWSPAPYNEIAYTARTGPGFDVKVKDLASGQVRQLTFGEGTNESPAFSPNGRHIAFMSTRSGKSQIFTMARDGRNLKQLTRAGNNQKPNWSN